MIHNIYDLEVSLSNIWMIGLFRSNKQDGNFFQNRRKSHVTAIT